MKSRLRSVAGAYCKKSFLSSSAHAPRAGVARSSRSGKSSSQSENERPLLLPAALRVGLDSHRDVPVFKDHSMRRAPEP